MPEGSIPVKPANEYTAEERVIVLREARLYMLEVAKRIDRLWELEHLLAEDEANDVSSQ